MSLRGKKPLRWVVVGEQNDNSTNYTILQRDRDECQTEELLSSFCSVGSSVDFLFINVSVRFHWTEIPNAVECSFGTNGSAYSARNTAFCLCVLLD